MKRVILQSRVVLTVLLVVFAGGCAANMAAPIAINELATSAERSRPPFDTARSSDAAQPDTAASGRASGLVAHIDPTTGEFLPDPPADRVAPPRAAEAAKASAPQLYEVPSPTPGGGVMIDLQDQFQTPLAATMDADGKVTVKHKPMSPAGAENK